MKRLITSGGRDFFRIVFARRERNSGVEASLRFEAIFHARSWLEQWEKRREISTKVKDDSKGENMFDSEKNPSTDFLTPTFASRFAKGRLFLATLMVCLSFTLVSARPEVRSGSAPSTTNVAFQQTRRFGPYATLRRANEVANYARRLGYKAKIFYSYVEYSRAYYVDVWQ